LADTGEAKPTRYERFPRYPAKLKSAGMEAGFAALFVLDTAGRVEYETVSFAPDVAAEFRAVVCSYLRDTQFSPTVRDGRPRRALVIGPFTFALEGGEWWRRRYDAEPLRRGIITEGIVGAVAQLEARQHC
jgi:hypothetical protein